MTFRPAWVLVTLLVLLPAVTGQEAGSQPSPDELIQAVDRAADAYASGERETALAELQAVLLPLQQGVPSDSASDLLEGVDRAALLARNQSDVRALADALLAFVALREAVLGRDHPDLHADRFDLALALGEAGELERAIALLEQLRAAFLELLPADDPTVIFVTRPLVNFSRRFGDLSRTLELEDALIAWLVEHTGDPSVDTLMARIGQADTLGRLGRWVDARQLALPTLAALRTLLEPDHPEWPNVLIVTSQSLFNLGELSAAEVLQREALSLATANTDLQGLQDHSAVQVPRLNLALTLREQGRLQEARALAEAAMDSYRRTVPPQHHERAYAHGILAGVLSQLGDLEAARELVEEGLEGLRAALVEGHHDRVQQEAVLAHLLLQTGDLDGALASWDAVYSQFADRPHDDPFLLDVALERANLMSLVGRWAETTADLDALLSRLPAGDEALRRATALLTLGATHFRAGRIDEAAAPLAEARALREQSLPADDTYVLDVLGWQIEVLPPTERRTVAHELARRLLGVVDFQRLLASPRELEAIAANLRPELSALVRAALHDAELVPDALAVCESFRGVGLWSSAFLRAANDDAVLEALERACNEAALRLTSALTAGDARDLLDARLQREAARRALAAHIGETIPAARQPPSAVGADLADGELLVGYWTYTTPDAGQLRLLGYSLQRDSTPRWRDLGELAHLRQLVACWRAAVGVPSSATDTCTESSVQACGEALTRALLSPLLPDLGAVSLISFQPDDALHLLPLGCCPGQAGCWARPCRCAAVCRPSGSRPTATSLTGCWPWEAWTTARLPQLQLGTGRPLGRSSPCPPPRPKRGRCRSWLRRWARVKRVC